MGRPPKYTPEFRRDAVEYCVSSGKTYAEVAASLGVNESTLAHWVRIGFIGDGAAPFGHRPLCRSLYSIFSA